MTRKERFFTSSAIAILLIGVPVFLSAYHSYLDALPVAREASAILSAAPQGLILIPFALLLPFAFAVFWTLCAFGALYAALGLLDGPAPESYMVLREAPITKGEWDEVIGRGKYSLNSRGEIYTGDASGAVVTAAFTDLGIRVSKGSPAGRSLSRLLASEFKGYVQQVACAKA